MNFLVLVYFMPLLLLAIIIMVQGKITVRTAKVKSNWS